MLSIISIMIILLQLILLPSNILLIVSVNPKANWRTTFSKKLMSNINTLPYIENKSNIFQPIDEYMNSIDLISDKFIPKNYNVLNVDKLVDKDINKQNQMLTDSKIEAIPFGLEILIGIVPSLMFRSFTPIIIIFAFELVFFGYISLLRNVWINKPKKLEEELSDRSWSEVWKSSLDSVEDPKKWFSSWYLNDPKFEDIAREDAEVSSLSLSSLSLSSLSLSSSSEDFLSWSMYNNVPSAISDQERLELNKSIKQIELYTNHKFPKREDRAPLVAMRSSLEKFKGNHKPLAFYLITQGIFGNIMKNDLKTHGFEVDTSIKPFRYFIKKPAQIQKELHPIVFMHGVGGNVISSYYN